ncbi:MAG: outer membrane beta-barrel protein [Porphyrobacter sp.]|nr:outer membrane beta-barrel protein [Porphyrobacter sp.]
MVQTAPAVRGNDPEYRVRPTQVGSLAITAGADLHVGYDDNIYAIPTDPIADEIVQVDVMADVSHRSGPFDLNLHGAFGARRYATYSTENAETYRVAGDMAWRPSQADALRLNVGYERAIEDRGDPEARDIRAIGPREIDIASAIAGYRRTSGKLLLDIEGSAIKNDAVSIIDADRDYTSYSGRATAGYRVGGSVFATATGFITNRDFRLNTTLSGLLRNTTTYGGRVGFEVSPGGVLEGNFSAGVFQHEPAEPTIDSYTGLSVAGQLVYRPTRRAAIILDALNGDVVTFRNGASGRTDTSVQLTWQHEIRHNLYSSLGAAYRHSKYRGSGLTEETAQGRFELEYLISRNLSVVADASYGKRTSEVPFDEFERFRGGVAARLRF